MSDLQPAEENWVTTAEAAEITGYNAQYLQKLAGRLRKQPEDERAVKILYRSGRYEFWLPDLITYVIEIGHGPHFKPLASE